MASLSTTYKCNDNYKFKHQVKCRVMRISRMVIISRSSRKRRRKLEVRVVVKSEIQVDI